MNEDYWESVSSIKTWVLLEIFLRVDFICERCYEPPSAADAESVLLDGVCEACKAEARRGNAK